MPPDSMLLVEKVDMSLMSENFIAPLYLGALASLEA